MKVYATLRFKETRFILAWKQPFSCITAVPLISVWPLIININLACESAARWKCWAVVAASSTSWYIAAYSSIEYTERGILKLNIIKYVNNPVTFLFRRSIPHRCATFPIQQEAAVRDKSHPVTNWTMFRGNNLRDATAVWLRAFSLSAPRVQRESVVQRGWQQAQETEQDVTDSAISPRMLENSSLTKASLFLSSFKCGHGWV